MKNLIYIFLFFFSLNGVAQQFAEKEYYLIDSLVLEELSEPDLVLLNNSLKLYHSAKDDTNKINALNNICENMLHDAWVKYNMWVFDFTEEKLKTKHTTQTTFFFKKSLASSINNIGISYYEYGDIPKAIFYYKKSMKIQEELGNTIGIAYSLNNLANAVGLAI